MHALIRQPMAWQNSQQKSAPAGHRNNPTLPAFTCAMHLQGRHISGCQAGIIERQTHDLQADSKKIELRGSYFQCLSKA